MRSSRVFQDNAIDTDTHNNSKRIVKRHLSESSNALSSEGCSSFVGSMSEYENVDPAERREVRTAYRTLIEKVQAYLDGGNENELGDEQEDEIDIESLITKSDTMYNSKVRRPLEASYDSEFLQLICRYMRKRAQKLQTNLMTFEPRNFADKLATYLEADPKLLIVDKTNGQTSPASSDEDEDQENCFNGTNTIKQRKIPTIGQREWSKLGIRTETMLMLPFRYSILNGSFKPDHVPTPIAAKIKKERQKKQAPAAVEKLKQIDTSKKANKTATEQTSINVLNVLKCLKRVCKRTKAESVPMFEFFIDPLSYSQSIENLFYLSFLVKDSFVSVTIDDNGLPLVGLTLKSREMNDSAYEESDNDLVGTNQTIFELSHHKWKELVDIYEPEESMIKPDKNST